jgi:hypothetical protein
VLDDFHQSRPTNCDRDLRIRGTFASALVLCDN